MYNISTVKEQTPLPKKYKRKYEKMSKIKEMIKKEKTTQTEFAKRFGIPLRTVQNWCRNERECPKYLENLIEKEIERNKK